MLALLLFRLSHSLLRALALRLLVQSHRVLEWGCLLFSLFYLVVLFLETIARQTCLAPVFPGSSRRRAEGAFFPHARGWTATVSLISGAETACALVRLAILEPSATLNPNSYKAKEGAVIFYNQALGISLFKKTSSSLRIALATSSQIAAMAINAHFRHYPVLPRLDTACNRSIFPRFVHNHNRDDDRDGRSNRHNSDDDIHGGIVQVICLRGRGEAQTQSDDQNCTPDISLGRVSPQCELGLLAALPRP